MFVPIPELNGTLASKERRWLIADPSPELRLPAFYLLYSVQMELAEPAEQESHSQPSGGEPIKTAAKTFDSPWAPLRQPIFRNLWLASVASFLGSWIHDVGANWLMTSLAPSPLMVSLIQTAGSLPLLMLSLPAGALADIVDKRRLIIFAQAWMTVAAAALGLLTVLNHTSAVVLLIFTFVLNVGAALNQPASQAILPEMLPRRELPLAVALGAVGFNVARALGPAVGGFIVAVSNSGVAFLVNALSFFTIIVVLYRWKREPVESVLPAERMVQAMKTGLRFVRHEPNLWPVLYRVAAFTLGGSALWALAALYARQNLGRGAVGYGVLVGFMGAGAVVGGTILPLARRRYSVERINVFSTIVYGAAVVMLGAWHHFPAACVAMLIAGSVWTCVLSTMSTTLQMSLPAWVRGRGLAVYYIVFFGAFATCSAGWGGVAQHYGIPKALIASGVVVILSSIVARWQPLVSGEENNLEPVLRPKPEVFPEPHPDHGPVLVRIEYQIDPANASEFKAAVHLLGRTRRRDGAMDWGLYEDPSAPGRYVENFLVESWMEYLRQHDRSTVSDRNVEERVRGFQLDVRPPEVSRFLYAYHPNERG